MIAIQKPFDSEAMPRNTKTPQYIKNETLLILCLSVFKRHLQCTDCFLTLHTGIHISVLHSSVMWDPGSVIHYIIIVTSSFVTYRKAIRGELDDFSKRLFIYP